MLSLPRSIGNQRSVSIHLVPSVGSVVGSAFSAAGAAAGAAAAGRDTGGSDAPDSDRGDVSGAAAGGGSTAPPPRRSTGHLPWAAGIL